MTNSNTKSKRDLNLDRSPLAEEQSPTLPSGGSVPGHGPLGVLGGPLAIGMRRSIGNLVHQRLRLAILNAQLLPGASLSETELASHLEVSRTPIREAMQKLEAEGLVQVIPQRGTFVARMNLARIQEALFMREAVECAAIERLPSPLPAESVEGLRVIVKRHTEAADQADSNGVLVNDDAFHRTLLELAGVPGAWRYVLEAREAHRRVRVLGHSEFQTAAPAARQHEEIISALAAGQPSEAAAILRRHIRGNVRFADDIAHRHPEYFTDPRARS